MCMASGNSEQMSNSLDPRLSKPSPSPGSIIRSVSAVGFITLACKVLGLIREIIIAASFGVGWIIDSHTHASLIPSFFLIAMGGLNGPVHSAIGAALSTQSDRATSRRPADCLVTVTTIVACVLSLATYAASDTIAKLLSPGLPLRLSNTVASQLQIMSPCIVFAALNGVRMARLTATRRLVVPVLSPAISSLTVIAIIAYYACVPAHVAQGIQLLRAKPEYMLALGTTLGAIIQCSVLGSFSTQHFKGGSFRMSSMASLGSTRVQSSMKMMLHACMTSGVLQIAACTDLFFASFVPHAAAGLGYASLLAMTPLGILSTSLMVPLAPLFAEHREPSQWHILKKLISKVLMVTFALAVLLAAILIPLAHPLVSLVFERQAFDVHARELVSAMFSIFITGGFTYIARDLIVRVFYSIGDGVPPFRTSILTVTVNGTLNWLFVCYFALGSQGIVLSTVIANGVSTLVLLYALTRKIGSLHHVGVPIQLIKVSVAGLLSSAATRLTQSYLISLQQPSMGMYVPFLTYSLAESAIVLCLSATSGVISFIITMVFLRADEFLRDDVFPV